MTINLKNLLANQVNAYLTYDDSFSNKDLKRITFLTASNGLFRIEKTDVAIYTTKISEFETEIPGLNPMQEGVELLVPKIPFKYLQMALSFYRDVYKADGTEASLLFFWNTDDKQLPKYYSDGSPVHGVFSAGQLVIYVPQQVNTTTLSEFHKDEAVTWMRDNLSLLCETHSHHSMNAFFSSTDDANENSTQFYGVWGQINKENPAFAFRFCSGNYKQKISPDVLFDWPLIHTSTTVTTSCSYPLFQGETHTTDEYSLFMGQFTDIEYPSDWFDQHEKKLSYKPSDEWTGGYSSLFDELEPIPLTAISANMNGANVLHYHSDTDKIL